MFQYSNIDVNNERSASPRQDVMQKENIILIDRNIVMLGGRDFQWVPTVLLFSSTLSFIQA